MEPKGFHRKLTAILSADVAGYSRLMQDDEAATVKTLESYKQAFSDLIKQHRGRVVDSPGDNLLAEFASVVDAVQCAVATQKELQARNTELPDNRKMQFRIGVNLGDVIEEESRIYGDGVNIAARLESLADPGGICVSKTAFDQIETKLPFGYEFLGEQSVKNITKPVGAYKVLMEPRVTKKKGAGLKQGAGRRMAVMSLAAALVVVAGVALWQFFLRPTAPPAPAIEKADPKQMALPLPELPSIAVLPFTNLSEDPKQQLLCDGITDTIINALSIIPRLLVIARNSTFAYKGKVVTVKQVSEELGVRYVLEGSLQRSGDHLRITVQLIDAVMGHQLFAERYDGETADIFALQDDITLKVMGAVRVKLTEGDQMSPYQKYFTGKRGLDCYLKGVEARALLQQDTIQDTNIARNILEEALIICPENPGLLRIMAIVYFNDYWLGSTKSPQETIKKAKEILQKILAIDDNNPEAHAYLSAIYYTGREHDKAIAEGSRALSQAPGSAYANMYYALALYFGGRPEEAIPFIEKAMRLNPAAPSSYYHTYGMALRDTGRLEAAVASFKRAIERTPNYVWSHAMLSVAYIMMDRNEEARAEVAEVLRINPNFSLEYLAKTSAQKDRAILDNIINSLRKAGLPDKSASTKP
jgi:adenylate cyclase